MEKFKKLLMSFFKICLGIAIWGAIFAAAVFLTIKSGVELECP